MWSCSPEVSAKFNNFKSWVAMSESMFEKYQQPPAPVDFNAAKKSVRDKQLVEHLEAFYKASSPPPEVSVMPESEKAKSDENIAYLQELDAFHKEFMPVVEKEIEFLQNNRTTADTTLFDMQVAYPLIHEEIENELEAREWFKDTEYEKKGGGGDHHH